MNNIVPLDNSEKQLLAKWFKGHPIKNENGELINHRVWFKNIFNPFLRKMGWVIVSKFSDDDILQGYEVRKYSKKLDIFLNSDIFMCIIRFL